MSNSPTAQAAMNTMKWMAGRRRREVSGTSFTLSLRPAFLLFSLLLISLSGLAQGIGPNAQYYPVYDFRNDWLVYDPAYKSYVPYIDEQHATIPSISVFLDVESNRQYSLLISTRQDGYLFINAALKRKLTGGSWQVLNLDSLHRAYRTPEVFLTIYGSPGVDDKTVLIGHRRPASQKPIILTDSGLSILPRRLSVFTNFFTLSLLFILASHAFLYNFHQRAFLRFYNLKDLLSVQVRDELYLINRPLGRVNLLFILNLSFIIAFLYLFIQSKNIDIFSSRALLVEGQRLGDLISSFFKLTALAFAAMTAKYLFLLMIGGLYKLDEAVSLHFFKILQSSLLFFTILALVVSVVSVNLPTTEPWRSTWLLVPFIGFYVARLALLYIVIANRIAIKNLYLFSYLCIVELIPLIIGVRFAL